MLVGFGVLVGGGVLLGVGVSVGTTSVHRSDPSAGLEPQEFSDST